TEVQGRSMHKKLQPNWRYALAGMALPALIKSSDKFARAQVEIDLAVVACALERHRLQTGDYPDSLDALLPRFLSTLPADVVNGEPLKYGREEGSFILYSVGMDLQNNYGTPV